jgi:hypothetical protein
LDRGRRAAEHENALKAFDKESAPNGAIFCQSQMGRLNSGSRGVHQHWSVQRIQDIFVKTVRSAGGDGGPAIVVAAAKMERALEERLEAAGAVVDKALGPDLMAQAADAALEWRRAAGQAH